MATVKTQLVIDGKNNSKKAFDEVNSQLDGMNSRIAAAGKALVGVFSAGALAGAVRGISNATGAWAEMTDRIKLATKSDKEYQESLDSLRKISNRTFTSMANNAEAFISSLTPLRERGFSTREALQFTEALGLGLVASAAKGEKAASVINQFSNALQDGVLRGDAFNSMIRNTPALADAMARGLGKSREELARMAKEGKLTTDVFVPALISQMDSLGGAVDGMQVTVADALTKLDNAWQEAIGQADVQPLVSAIEELAETIRDPAIVKGLVDIASGMATLAGWTLQVSKEFTIFADKVAFTAAQMAAGSEDTAKQVAELEKLKRALAEVNAARTGSSFFGASTTSLLMKWFAPEQLEEWAKELEAQIAEFEQRLFGITQEQVSTESSVGEELDDLRSEDVASRRKHVAMVEAEQKLLISAAEAAGKSLIAAEKKANSELERIKKDRLGIEQRYAEAIAKFRSGGQGGASFGQYQDLKIAAQRALNAGDAQGAQRQAQAALKVLEDLQAAGESTYGFEGLAKGLQAIENAAKDLEQRRAEQKLTDLKQEMINIKSAAAELEDMPVSVQMDDAKLAEVQAKLDALASREIIVKVGAQYDFSQPYTLQDPGPAPQKFATGGYISGPGTGTSDSIPAYLSNGEYVIRAAAVRKLGKRHLDMLNNGIPIPRFADGGMVGTVASLDTAASGPSRGVVNLTLPGGETYTMLAEADQFDRLLSNTARKFGRTHRGP